MQRQFKRKTVIIMTVKFDFRYSSLSEKLCKAMKTKFSEKSNSAKTT